MPSLNDVRVDASEWTLVMQSGTETHWRNAVGDLLSLHHFELPPDIPAPLEQLSALRANYRKGLSQRGGGIVEVETQPVAGMLAVRSIFKFPQKPHGMAYVASLTLPFAECSFVLKVQCVEQGTTGLRDSAILGQLMSQAQLTTDEQIRRWMNEQWFQDPYEPADRSPVRRNLSEAPSYDARFPAHPLSRARRYLAGLASTLRLSPALLRTRPFTGPAQAPREQDAPPAMPGQPMDIRNHHYIFAHLALPQLLLSDPERFLGALHEDGKVFLEHLWKKVGEQVPGEEVLGSEGMEYDFRVDTDALLAIIRLPAAQADAEALLVGCHCWKAPPSNPATTPRARYFTLELGGQEVGAPHTVFCEWQQENGRLNHANYGTGPDTVRDFVAAIQHKVRPSSKWS